MSSDEILLDCEEAMEKAVEYMVHEFASIRTGKASPALVENLEVEAYGAHMRLKQLAVITTPESRMIVIQPFDSSTLKDIERGIKESRVGIMPIVDGKIIRLPIPELSAERRKDLVKSTKQMAEDARVRLRSSRRTAIEDGRKIQKAGDLTEDQLKDLEADVQKLTDKYVSDIDRHLDHKEKEITTV